MTNNGRHHTEVSNEEQTLSQSVSMRKLLIPVILGLGVLVFMSLRSFDMAAFKDLSWNGKTILYFGIAIVFFLIRHLLLSIRLRAVSDNVFSFLKSLELITIWEFASTVSPTSLGGSAVSIFLIAQEKVSAAKSVAMVLYTVVLDTIFFAITIPLLYFFFGKIVLRPLDTVGMGGYVTTMWIVYAFTLLYGGFIILGIYKPRYISWLIDRIANWKIMKRFRESLHKTADELAMTSKELRTQSNGFHLAMMGYTTVIWILRFGVVAFVILGVVQSVIPTLYDTSLLIGRAEMMHVITQFSPTPGGSGVVEGMFGGFFSDYITKGVATAIAFIWRLITYYPYLILGIFVVPNWLRKVVKRRNAQSKS